MKVLSPLLTILVLTVFLTGCQTETENTEDEFTMADVCSVSVDTDLNAPSAYISWEKSALMQRIRVKETNCARNDRDGINFLTLSYAIDSDMDGRTDFTTKYRPGIPQGTNELLNNIKLIAIVYDPQDTSVYTAESAYIQDGHVKLTIPFDTFSYTNEIMVNLYVYSDEKYAHVRLVPQRVVDHIQGDFDLGESHLMQTEHFIFTTFYEGGEN